MKHGKNLKNFFVPKKSQSDFSGNKNFASKLIAALTLLLVITSIFTAAVSASEHEYFTLPGEFEGLIDSDFTLPGEFEGLININSTLPAEIVKEVIPPFVCPNGNCPDIIEICPDGNCPEDNYTIIPPQHQIIDIVFVIDSTGSMSDEIREVKTHLVKIIKEVKKGKPSPELRVGIVVYRDHRPEEKEYDLDYKSRNSCLSFMYADKWVLENGYEIKSYDMESDGYNLFGYYRYINILNPKKESVTIDLGEQKAHGSIDDLEYILNNMVFVELDTIDI